MKIEDIRREVAIGIPITDCCTCDFFSSEKGLPICESAVYGDNACAEQVKYADQILSIKVGDYTLKELIERELARTYTSGDEVAKYYID